MSAAQNAPADVVSDVLADVLDMPADDLTPDTAFADLEKWDSMAALEVLVQIEDAIGSQLDMSAYHMVRTVGELVELVGATAVS